LLDGAQPIDLPREARQQILAIVRATSAGDRRRGDGANE
jgi:hypothetical protein